MKYTKLTLNQAKMVINDFLLDQLGIKAEKLIDEIDKSKDENELRNHLSQIARAVNSDIAGELVVLWKQVAAALKANREG